MIILIHKCIYSCYWFGVWCFSLDTQISFYSCAICRTGLKFVLQVCRVSYRCAVCLIGVQFVLQGMQFVVKVCSLSHIDKYCLKGVYVVLQVCSLSNRSNVFLTFVTCWPWSLGWCTPPLLVPPLPHPQQLAPPPQPLVPLVCTTSPVVITDTKLHQFFR